MDALIAATHMLAAAVSWRGRLRSLGAAVGETRARGRGLRRSWGHPPSRRSSATCKPCSSEAASCSPGNVLLNAQRLRVLPALPAQERSRPPAGRRGRTTSTGGDARRRRVRADDKKPKGGVETPRGHYKI
eukprot:scaffold90928_cov28-Tisochrysis_lutea.AAC.8